MNVVRELKKLESTIACPRSADERHYQHSILVFVDESRIDDCGQLGVVTCLLIGELKNNSIYNVVLWISDKVKRSVMSVLAAEVLVAAEGIGDGKSISRAYSELFCTKVILHLCVDSIDFFTLLYA